MRVGGIGSKVVIGLLCIGLAASAPAQQCDDGNVCTTNDACSEGICDGTPQSGGNCEISFGNECMVNGHCLPDGSCGGEAAPNGTPCAGGCGTCLVLAPGAPALCSPRPDVQGQACDAGIPCLDGTCQVIAGTIVSCLPGALECPDTDGNPCTDGCNFETGECETDAPKCFPPCETCNAGTGACQPVNIGGACDDFNVCTAQSSCQEINAGKVVRGFCLAGEPTGATPTVTPDNGEPTVTPGNGGPTVTPTVPPTPGECVGDCNGNDEVTLGEVQTAFNIFLGTAAPGACTDADTNNNNEVSLGEVQMSFNGFLGSCTG